MYWWQGKIVEDKEMVVIAKTTDDKYEAVRAKVREMHSYEVPAIIRLPVTDVDARYLAWLEAETQAPDEQ
jgi:periplasmic divalent cation tolerance protein